MTAEQAKSLATTLGQQLQKEWMTTYKVLSAIPEDKKDWKPEPNARMLCNNHMVHHRGQLATYLRPMGGKVPSMYGGSFDEAYQP